DNASNLVCNGFLDGGFATGKYFYPDSSQVAHFVLAAPKFHLTHSSDYDQGNIYLAVDDNIWISPSPSNTSPAYKNTNAYIFGSNALDPTNKFSSCGNKLTKNGDCPKRNFTAKVNVVENAGSKCIFHADLGTSAIRDSEGNAAAKFW